MHYLANTSRQARPVRDLLFVRCPRRVRRALRWRTGSVSLSSHHVPYRPLALLAGALLSAGAALANPNGAQVVAGTVHIVGSVPNTLDIRQASEKAVINWTSFSIQSGETVNFVQPSVNSVTLNRVLGNDPSAIFGRLNANGTVMLVNPNGIVFGPTARVDVGGLIATTANIRDDDFLAGRYQFGEASTKPQARIVNQGEITIKNAGLAALVAPSVQNAGVIQARLGQVVLGGVSTFTLDFQGDGLLSFSAGQAVAQRPVDANGQPVAALVSNTGTVQADGGTVLLTARAVQGVIDQVINTSGIVSATAVSEQGGRIVLTGGDTGQVVAGGTLDASGRGVGQHGGQVTVTGDQVQVAAGARLDVAGSAGGGEIALGSQGVASGFADKSRTTTVAAGAQLHADALDQGDGGSVTVWSKETTRFAGALSARGGAQGGDGGFAEISSQKDIALTGSADLRAPHGATGTLLLDPTSLRITDTANGGAQDGNAADGSVAASDGDQGLNTVSRGLLEGLAGNANITLQATGQITVDAMASGRIDLQTTTGNTFTLQSTQNGGIQFADAATEIRTQGGNLTLDAQGVGSALANIGKLTSNGGAITLTANGNIELAGALDAGSGAVNVQSTVGSIANAAGTSPLLSGGAVTLSAASGHVGSAGHAIDTHTARLTLSSGGHLVAASDMALTDLSITAAHVAPTPANQYQVSATGLTFQVSDGASALDVAQVSQAAGLNLTLSADRSLQLGTVNTGTGTLTLGSTGGHLLGAADTALTAGTLVLKAQGTTGSNGAIGTSGQALLTAAAHLDATAGSGGVYVTNTGALALDHLRTTGTSTVIANGTLTAGDVNAGSATLSLGASGGSVLDDGDATTRISASTLLIGTSGAIGSSGTRLSTNAGTITAAAESGGVYLGTSATSSVLTSIQSGDGAIDIRTGGSTTLTSLNSSTSSASNGITVTATGTGSMSVGTVNAGTQGNVALTTTSGSIFGNSGLITGNTVTLNAANSGSVSVRTAASHLDVQAGSSSISITQTGAVTLDRIATPSTFASVTSSSGDITVGSVSTASSGQVTLTASAGAILDDGDSTTRIRTGTATLSASGAIGAPGQAVQTQATGLSASSTGDLVITNQDATLTSLAVTNRHSAPGNAATLQVVSPYLVFDVTDTGTSYTLNRIVGLPLGSLSFNGDAALVLGQVQATGSVSLTSTQGDITDDGNLNTRVTSGSTLSLSATQGSVGSATDPIGVNAASLSLTTRGDLYVTDVADLSTLTINSTHPDSTTPFGLGITAPSLKFDVTDSAAGHAVHTLTDTTSLTLNFTSDRDITLGAVDLTGTGTARFTSTTGVLKDDGDKTTRVLANSTSLTGRAVGAAGNDHLDVVTGTLAASASAGGIYVEVPMPTGSTNTTSTVTLGTLSAAGPVVITALEGDLSLGGFMTATNQAVSLTASQGAILSPIGYSIGIGTGSLVLNAAKGIGSSGQALVVTNSAGATLTAQAGTSMFIGASGAMTLTSLDAASGITYTQSSGAITVGHVDATTGGTVALTASSGSIQDDGNGATGVRAQQVTLSAAQGSVGSGTALSVNTPKLLVTANGDIGVADSATLDTLSITRGSGSAGSIALTAGAGQAFTISEDGTAHDLQAVTSSTPLAFSFSGQRDVKIGQIDVGSAGSASIGSAANLANDGSAGAGITAGTVALSAGTTGSIGAAGSGNAIALTGTTGLTLSTGRNVFVASDTALTDLAITSTNTTTVAGTASAFGVSGLGQTFGITDSGTTQSLNFSGTALTNASFVTRKNIEVGALTATGDVTLTTSGGGANSNISSDAGSGRIAGNRVLLTATSSTAGGGSIGSNSRALRVDTPTLVLTGSANVYVADAQDLTGLNMTLTHGTNTTFGYDVTAGNLTLGISDGSTQGLSLATSGSMDFAYSVDRGLSLGTIDAGTSSTGTIALTSRSAPTGTNPQINRGSGSLTAGSISLSAVGTNGAVGAGGTLSTNTQNLSIASGGNVSVSNATTLSSLSLDAQHRTTGSTTHSYAISATGLTFSISDSLGTNAFQLSNITQSGLALSVKADRTITATRVNTGAGGTATLQSSSGIQGGSGANAGSPSITTGDLTLKGSSAYGYQGSTPLYTAAATLNSTLTSTLYLSNAGSLTLGTNTVGSSADVASSNNSLLQGNGGLFTAPTLKLSANQSLGVTGSLLTDARRLTVVSRGDIDVANASDLYALSVTSTHGTPGAQNTLAVAAPRLTMTLSDSAGGNEYHLSQLADSSGLDFTLSTDVALNLGTVDAQAGRALALYSTGTGTSITNDGSSLLRAGSITLSASGSVGAAGSSATRMQTDALGVALITGANAYADNARDLTALSLTSTQTAGGSAPVYQVSAPSLTFDVTDDGITHLNQVADSTGLNFTVSTRRDQAVGVIDVGRSGSVSLTSAGDILGDADSSHRISAGSAAFSATAGGAIGSLSNPIHLSAPLVTLAPTGALNIESDTHIDRLGITTTHPTATYGGTYSIVSVPFTGAAYALFTATDSVTGTALTNLYDPLGLAFSFTSDRAMQVGTLDLGNTGSVALTGTGSGGIVGDGDPNTLVRAATLTMASLGGAVGASGSGNGIDATVNTVSASALGGGVNLALHGRTTLGSVSGTGGVSISDDEGDIALGSINAGGSAVSINNQGGSILSGSIVNATTVALTASGSIGNDSAVTTMANGGGTTTLTASASAAHGASGSIAVSESYNLTAASVTAPAGVTLTSNLALYAGTVTSGGAVALSSSQGSINGSNGSNAVTGTSVTLSARYGTGNTIGNSEVRLNVNTPQLVLNTPGSVYVTDSADLNKLTFDRTNYSGTGSSGTLSVVASGLSFSASDSSNLTAINSLADGTGLDFTYLGVGSVRVHDVNVGSGSMLLQASLSNGDGNITALNSGSLVTAGTLTLQAYGTGSAIGSSGTALNLAVGTLTASAGTGGVYLQQAGALSLSSVSTTGDLAVTTTSGDLTLGTVSYGSAKTLTLNASGGSLLAGGGTLAGGSAGASITLSAANGIGTAAAPILVNASAGHTLNASVTGTGSLFLNSLGTLNGGLTTSVHDGATTVTAAGATRLTSMTSGTDRAGNDIQVIASAGDITVVSVSGGANAQHTGVTLDAMAGQILAASGSSTFEAHDVQLHGRNGVGTSGTRIGASGERVQVSSNGGALYLKTSSASTLTSAASNGGLIDIAAGADVLLANVVSSGGNITVSGGANQIIAGNVNAGSGSVSLVASSAGGKVVDDGNASTRVVGQSVTLTGDQGVGTSSQAMQTTAGTLTLASNTTGTGIFVGDDNSAGVTVTSARARGGDLVLRTAGPTTVNTAQVDTDGRSLSLGTSSGNLTVGTVTAGTGSGSVSLQAAGSILASGNSTNVTARSLWLDAGGDIGVVTNTTTGAGTPLVTDVARLQGVSLAGGTATVQNVSTAALALNGGNLSVDGGTLYVKSAGDMAVTQGVSLNGGSLSLDAAGTLTLPGQGIATSGQVRLIGTTDIVSSGSAPRTLAIEADGLTLRSGAAGGSTTLTTTLHTVDAALTGAGDLVLNNTGTLTAATLATTDGNLTATSSTGLAVNSATAGGSTAHTLSLTATAGDLTVGTLNAGANGSIVLSAAAGALIGNTASLTARSLDLTSLNAIGSTGNAFATDAEQVSAHVTGTGGIYLDASGPLTLGTVTTHDGDIAVHTQGALVASGTLTAGNSGNVHLQAQGGNVTLTQAYASTGSDATRAGLTVSGDQISLAGVTTAGAQSYTATTTTIGGDLTGGAVTVTGNALLAGADRTLDTHAANGTIILTGTLDGAGHGATLTAGTGQVALQGAASQLASLAVSAAQIGTAGVATTGAQQYTGATTLAGTYATQGGAFGITGATTLAGTTLVTSAGGAATFGGTVDGAQALTVNSSGATTFGGAVNVASVSTDAAGTLALNGGSITTTGTQTYGENAVLGTDTTLTGSTVTLASASMRNGSTASLTVDGAAVLNGNVTTTGAQAYTGAVTLGSDVVASGTDIGFGGTVNGAHALTVHGSGATTFGGAVNVASVSTDATGTLAVNGGSITTTGTQSYGESAVLGADTTLTGSTVTLGGASVRNGSTASLTIDGAAVLNGNVTTTGAQVYTGAVTLGSDVVASGTDIGFGSTVNGAHALTVNGSGATTFAGTVNVASVSTDAAGTLALNGGAVTTTGTQSYGESAVLGADTTLTGPTVTLGGASVRNGSTASLTIDGAAVLNGNVTTTGAQVYTGAVTLGNDVTASGTDIGFGSTVNGAHALTVHGSGATTFGGAVNVASVSTDAAGTLALNGGTVTTTGTQTYGETAVLGTDTTLTGSTVTLAGASVRNGSTASLTIDGAAVLNGNVTTTGAQVYTGAVTLGSDVVASGTDIGFGSTVHGAHALTVHGNGATTFGGAVNVASVSTDAAGTLALNGSSITTTGTQHYGETAVLGANTTLAGTTVTLGNGVEGSTAGGESLSITGNALINGNGIGATTALRQVSISGTTTLNGGTLRTTGSQAYTGALTLGQDVVATGTDIGFGGTVNGAHALTVHGSGATTFGGAVNVASVSTDAAGTLAINGGSITTTGTQSYGEAAVLGTDTTLTGTTVTLAGASVRNGSTASLTIDGAAVLNGNVTTTGAQVYTGAVTLGSDVVASGTDIGFGSTVNGAHALTVHGSGATTFAGAVNVASVSTDAAGTLALNGGSITTTGTQSYGESAVLGADTTLTGPTVTLGGASVRNGSTASLTIDGAAVLNGNVTTTGAQVYTGAVTLGSDVVASGTDIGFGGTVDGAHALAVNGSGATTFAGAVNVASVSTDAAGTLALNGGSVTTTGTQTYGETAVIGANTTLTGSTVRLLAGVDGSSNGSQALAIVGDAALGGGVGAVHALASLSISGAATLASGSVATAGDQSYAGAVMLAGDQQLTSRSGAIHFASTLDAADRANLSLSADAGALAIDGAVGAAQALGALTVHAGTTLDFGGSLKAYRLVQTGAGGLAHYRGAVFVEGLDGIALTGQAFAFDQAVTAAAGALQVAHTGANSSTTFAREAAVSAATGFTQTGAGSVQLPASVSVTRGPITLEAPATLHAGDARIETEGNITMTGLSGPATSLVLASGRGTGSPAAGKLTIGLNDGRADHQINVANLAVPDATAATLFGIIGGQGGALAASRINSALVNDPYYINQTPWGPVEVINLLIATTVPSSAVPSTPGAGPLFTSGGAVSPASVAPNALTPYVAPPVLNVLNVQGAPKVQEENGAPNAL